MNNKTNKINNKPVFIVLLLFVSVIVLFFTSKLGLIIIEKR